MKLWHHIPERVKLVTPQLGKCSIFAGHGVLQATVIQCIPQIFAWIYARLKFVHLVLQASLYVTILSVLKKPSLCHPWRPAYVINTVFVTGQLWPWVIRVTLHQGHTGPWGKGGGG
jgi:hypothetical protein